MRCTGLRSPRSETRASLLAGLLLLLPPSAFALFGGETGTSTGTSPEPGNQAAERAATDDGLALIEENCLFCHDDSFIRSANLNRDQWEQVLDLMLGMGMAPLEPEVQETVLDYLEENHGTRPPSSAGNKAAASSKEAASSEPGMEDLPWAFPRYRPNPLFWRER